MPTDFSSIGGVPDVAPPPQAINFSSIGGVPDAAPAAAPSPTDALSKATGISAGPGWLSRKVDEIKAGLTGAQEGGGLIRQPTALGNAAEAAGGLAEGITTLGLSPETLAPGDATLLSKIDPGVHFNKARPLFQDVENVVGGNTVQITDRLKSALDATKEEMEAGGGGGSIASKLMTRMANTDDVPLTFSEARRFYSNLGDLTTSDKMASNTKMLRHLTELKSALGETIENTAEAGGKLPQYQQAMQSWSKGAALQEKVEVIKDWAKKVGIGALVTTTGGGLGAAGWDLYKQLFGKP